MLKKTLLLIILLNCFLINPEVLVLENGEIIDGKIIKMDEDTFTIITKNKEIVIDRDKIIQTFRSIDEYNKSLKTEKKEAIEKGKLIAEWLFNGNANDTSGNTLNGKIFGSKTLVEDRFGNKNSAYEFGANKTNLIKVDKNKNILQRQVFSLSVWVKVKKYTNYARIIDFWNWNSKKGYSIWCTLNGKINFNAWISDSVNTGISTKTNLNRDIWYHIVLIHGKDKTMIYLNSELENENITNSNISQTNLNETNFYIGGAGSNDYYSYQFYGCIDDIRFYDYAISEEEIKKLYHENGWPK